MDKTPLKNKLEEAAAGALRRNVELADLELVARIRDGRLEVTGIVHSWTARMHANATVQRVARGLPVVNNVRVRLPGSGREDDGDIRRAVLDTLRWHALLPGRDIMVHVARGWVRLQGEVPVDAERVDAETAVRALANVAGVINELVVADPDSNGHAEGH